MTLELLLSEHRVVCTTCDRDGDCLLQDYAYRYQAAEDRFPSVATPPDLPNYTTGNKAIQYDPSKCVRCQRCVKICAEVEMAEALTMRDRGAEMQVSTGFDVELNESTCELCGLCISACPTAALHERFAHGTGSGQGPGQGPHHLHLLRRRLPDGPERQPRDQPHRPRHRRAWLRAQRRQPVRQGPFRVRVRLLAGAPDHAADPRERAVPPAPRGRRRSHGPPPAWPQIRDTHGPDAIAFLSSCALHQRGELPGAEARAHGRQDQQHRPVRHHLSRPDRRGAGRGLRFRGDDQLHRRDQERADALPHRRQPHRGAPHRGAGDEEGPCPRRAG